MESKLTERQITEKKYHNKINKRRIDYYQDKPPRSYQYFYSLIYNVNKLKLLDFGCGEGWLSVQLAQKGAHVWGMDISEMLIRKANCLIKESEFFDQITFSVMTAESLDYENDFFDLIFGSAILHHTDLDQSIREISRVLKKDGKAIFIEPMNQNFILKLWRWLTPWRRSSTEKALVWDDITFIQTIFPNTKKSYFGFFSILTSGIFILFPKNRFVNLIHNFLEYIDKKILSVFPFLGKYAAVVVFEMKK